MNGIDEIVIFFIIVIVIGFVNWLSIEDTKTDRNFSEKNEAIVREPRFYKWVGVVVTIITVIMTFGDTFFPGISAVKTPFMEMLPLSFPCFLLGTYLISVGLFWKITVNENSNYFIYRSIFNRTYKIPYNDISYYKTGKQTMTFMYKKKFFVVDTNAVNYKFLLQMLIKKNVKKKYKGA